MGAAIALRFTLETPRGAFIGLVLSRPAWLDQSRGDNLKVFSTLAGFIRKVRGRRKGARRYQETAAYRQVLKESPDGAKSLLSQFRLTRAPKETVAKLERIPPYLPAHTREHWKLIRVPTLVLANHQDPVHPLEFGEVLARTNSRAARFCGADGPSLVSLMRPWADDVQAGADGFSDEEFFGQGYK